MNDQDRIKDFMESPYVNFGGPSALAEERIANALAYIAYQLGEIKVTLREINARDQSDRA